MPNTGLTLTTTRRLAVLVAVVALIALTGWWTGVRLLYSFGPQLPATTPATALQFLLLAASLWWCPRSSVRPSAYSIGFALAAGGVALWTLASYASALPGPEQLIPWLQVGQSATNYPGRSSPQTAISVLLLAVGLLAAQPVRGPHRVPIADAAATVAMLIAWTSCIGYATGLVELRGLSDSPDTALAVPTALAVAACGIALLHRSAHTGFLGLIQSNRTGGLLLRIALPLVLLLPFAYSVLGWFLGDALGLADTWLRFIAWVLLSAGVAAGCAWLATVLNRHERTTSLARRRHAALQLLEAKHRVSETEERYQLIFNTLPVGVVVVAASGRIVQSNPAFTRIFGHEVGALVGSSIDELVPQQVRELHAKLRHSYMLAPDARRMGGDRNLAGLRADGSQVAVEVGLTPATLEGKPCVIASVIDVSQKLDDQARLQLALSGGTIGLWDWWIGTDLLTVSDELLVLLGRREPLRSRNELLDLIHSEDLDRVLEKVEKVLPTSDNDYVDTLRIRHADGHYLVVLSRGHIHRDEAGKPIRMLGSLTDITEQQRSEDQLRKYASALEKSYQELDSFTYIASHDLKSPLQAIQSLADWLISDTKASLDEQSARHLQLLKSRATRMDQLLDDLLTYCRIGNAHYKPEPVDIVALAEEAFDFCNPPSRINFQVGAVEVHTIVAPQVPLEVCLRNLIGNAVKHHHAAEGRVTVAVHDLGDHAKIEISDDGPGIAPAYHAKVFELFQRLKSRDQIEGSGMGLTIVKKTVENYGGEISIQSTPGQGTTIAMTWAKNAPMEQSDGRQDGSYTTGRR